jgi:hypothetical protein
MKKASPYRPLTYLACPYSHPDPEMLNYRFNHVTRAAARLMVENPKLNVFSPITNSHPLHVVGMRGDWETWKRIDTQYLRLCKAIIVLKLDGWTCSVGVTEEIKIAKKLGMRISYLDPTTFKLSRHPFNL